MDDQKTQTPQSRDPVGILTTVEALFSLSKTLMWVVVLGVFLASAIVSICLTTSLATTEKTTWSSHLSQAIVVFIASFLVNLAAAAAIYLMSVFWFIPKWREIESKKTAEDLVVHPLYKFIGERIDALKSNDVIEYRNQFSVPWNDEIGRATKTIDICVQGWDGLVKHHKSAWESFFGARGGTVNLYLPKIGNDIDTMVHMTRRLGRSEITQAAEINNTFSMLEKIKSGEKCQGRGEINLCSFEPMIWYCLVRIDSDVAFISCYEHVDGGTIEAPFLKIHLNKFPIVRDWIDKELKGMTEAVRKSASLRSEDAPPRVTVE